MKRAVSAIVIAKQTRRIALVRRKNEPRKGEWSLPGGSCEDTETERAAILRELREEISLDATDAERIDAIAETRVPFGNNFYAIVVFLVVLGDEPTITAHSDASDAIWISPRDARAHGLAEDTARIVDDAYAQFLDA